LNSSDLVFVRWTNLMALDRLRIYLLIGFFSTAFC